MAGDTGDTGGITGIPLVMCVDVIVDMIAFHTSRSGIVHVVFVCVYVGFTSSCLFLCLLFLPFSPADYFTSLHNLNHKINGLLKTHSTKH